MTKTIEEAAKEAVRKEYLCEKCAWKDNCDFCGGENTAFDCCECPADSYEDGFKAGASYVYGLPLASRLTAQEKERVKGIYNEELGMAQHFHIKAKASNDISCRQHYYGLREPYISRMKLLERIFGADFFKEGE